MTREDVEEWFISQGLYTRKIVILKDPEGRSKGCGFADFASPEDAKTAVEQLTGTEIRGRKVIMSYAKPRAPRAY